MPSCPIPGWSAPLAQSSTTYAELSRAPAVYISPDIFDDPSSLTIFLCGILISRRPFLGGGLGNGLERPEVRGHFLARSLTPLGSQFLLEFHPVLKFEDFSC